MTRLLGLALLLSAVWAPSTASAWREGGAVGPGDPSDCTSCHTEDFPFDTRSGPHANFSATSDKCSACHTIHEAAGEEKLLPRDTASDTCWFCHDGTGGGGVYGSIQKRGLTVRAQHRIDTTAAVPGGSASTGGTETLTFSGENGCLSCIDCHSPHDSNTVAPFNGERVRFHASDLGWLPVYESSKLLRQRPVGSDTTVSVYGSDWCAGCHRGRLSGMTVLNHPVDSLEVRADAFYYNRVAIVSSATSTETTFGPMGLLGTLPSMIWHNRGFVMPEPRTAEQGTHGPICQQCHEDARAVGRVGAVEWAQVYRYGDGIKEDAGTPTDTPLFQNFPHESQSERFLVETADDLCTNCHDPELLP